MQGFAQSMGVRCVYCHVAGPDPSDMSAYNFESDRKEHKETTRAMMKYTDAVNQSFPTGVGDEPKAGEQRVTCYTCHQGQRHPPTKRPEPKPARRRAPQPPRPPPDAGGREVRNAAAVRSRRAGRACCAPFLVDNACLNTYCHHMQTDLQVELKQTRPFRSPIEEAFVALQRTAAVLEHALETELKAVGHHRHAVQRPPHPARRRRRGLVPQ